MVGPTGKTVCTVVTGIREELVTTSTRGRTPLPPPVPTPGPTPETSRRPYVRDPTGEGASTVLTTTSHVNSRSGSTSPGVRSARALSTVSRSFTSGPSSTVTVAVGPNTRLWICPDTSPPGTTTTRAPSCVRTPHRTRPSRYLRRPPT